MDLPLLARRTRAYLGFSRPGDPPIPAASTRRILLLAGVLFVLGIVGLIIGPTWWAFFFFATCVATFSRIFLRRSQPERRADDRGWYIDPEGSGKWLWWDGSEWTDGPR